MASAGPFWARAQRRPFLGPGAAPKLNEGRANQHDHMVSSIACMVSALLSIWAIAAVVWLPEEWWAPMVISLLSIWAIAAIAWLSEKLWAPKHKYGGQLTHMSWPTYKPAPPPTSDHPPPYQSNPTPHIKEIAELKVQNARLMAMLEHTIVNGTASNIITSPEAPYV